MLGCVFVKSCLVDGSGRVEVIDAPPPISSSVGFDGTAKHVERAFIKKHASSARGRIPFDEDVGE